MREIHSYKPLPRQEDFHRACYNPDYDAVLYLGAFGGGKSLALVQQFADMALQYPGSRYMICRKRYADLKDTTLVTFKESVDSSAYRYYKTDHDAVFKNGSKIMFRGLDKMTKVGSIEVACVGVDEMYELNFDEFKMLKARARQKGIHKNIAQKIIGATNPCDIGEWMHTYFEKDVKEKGIKGRFYIKTNTLENPYLPEHYVRNLMRDYPPSWVRRFIYGEWGSVPKGDPVFSNFLRDMHGKPWHVDEKMVPIQGLPVLRGWDFGWHRPASILAQHDPDGRLLIHEIMMGDREYLVEYAPKIISRKNQLFPGYTCYDYGDHAGHQVKDTAEKTAIQLLDSEFKIRVVTQPAHISSSLERMQKMLGTVVKKAPMIVVHPRCEILIAGFEGGYCRIKPKDGRQMDIVPYKDGFYEHPMDALRYIIDGVFQTTNQSEKLDHMPISQPGWSYNHSAGSA